ncbi:hypothetical protein ALC57_08396 [Trachymyrmex cornetzi]|uniref:Uncharacterized protein n=1 Tax=Trachymyrmex cornetzi TaxID=471704 RepID=A0A195E2V7_9HYME|nr:hypothetical protein ALC57_08396 [Trachymyrmex cornetzi]
MVDSAGLRRIVAGESGEDGRVADGRHTGMVGGRKNGRSRGAEPRRGSHASTPITRDSLTIGFPLAVTEIYRKPVHLVPRASGVGPRAPGCGRFAIPQLHDGGKIEARDPIAAKSYERPDIRQEKPLRVAEQSARIDDEYISLQKDTSPTTRLSRFSSSFADRLESVGGPLNKRRGKENGRSYVLSQGEDDEVAKIRETRGKRASLNGDRRGEDKGGYSFKLWWPSYDEWSRSCKTETARCQAASLERACWNAQERARTLWGLQQSFAAAANRNLFLHPSSKSWLAETIIGADETRSPITTYFHSYPFVPGGAVPLPPPLLNGINNPAAAAITPGLVGHLFDTMDNDILYRVVNIFNLINEITIVSLIALLTLINSLKEFATTSSIPNERRTRLSSRGNNFGATKKYVVFLGYHYTACYTTKKFGVPPPRRDRYSVRCWKMPLFLLREVPRRHGKRGKNPFDLADTSPPGCFLCYLSLFLSFCSFSPFATKLSYLSRWMTPTTRKRGRRGATKGFRVFLGCHIIVTVHGNALLLQMSELAGILCSRQQPFIQLVQVPIYLAIVIIVKRKIRDV